MCIEMGAKLGLQTHKGASRVDDDFRRSTPIPNVDPKGLPLEIVV